MPGSDEWRGAHPADAGLGFIAARVMPVDENVQNEGRHGRVRRHRESRFDGFSTGARIESAPLNLFCSWWIRGGECVRAPRFRPAVPSLLPGVSMKSMTLIPLSFVALATGAFGQETGNAPTSGGISSPAVSLEPAKEPGYPDRRIGVGLMAGEPSGVSLKYWLSEDSAIDAGVGWSFHDDDDFHFHADYLFHLFDLIPFDPGRMPVYFGGGARVKIRDHRDDLFGLRAVAGVEYLFEKVPVDLFVEAGPVFDVAPDFEVRFTAAIGARYWF